MQDMELQALAEQISEQYFGRPFKHRAIFNAHLRTTGGRYMLQTHHIEINPKYFQYYGTTEVIAILKHELCHYHLHLLGKGYRHRDRDFKELLAKVGGQMHCKPLPQDEKTKRTIHFYQCVECGLVYKRKRRMDPRKYACGNCSGKIQKVEEILD
ncbi:SprT family protein [Aliibacillus thermotolerans]|uniref:Protein SprT-like n=1 Tax=Aliibacillus thermotolerans TaxID=1834418 RepID=A0ABW0U8J0_9BACI|nr:SprT family protein [Aliibacillus thermotolerans]MDA3129592.1 SprT family protein [Aliibacillus thermotolerans]